MRIKEIGCFPLHLNKSLPSGKLVQVQNCVLCKIKSALYMYVCKQVCMLSHLLPSLPNTSPLSSQSSVYKQHSIYLYVQEYTCIHSEYCSLQENSPLPLVESFLISLLWKAAKHHLLPKLEKGEGELATVFSFFANSCLSHKRSMKLWIQPPKKQW